MRVTRVYNDGRDPGWCIAYGWHEREQREDSYLGSDWELVKDLTDSELDRDTWRQVSRMRRRTEYRPWHWRRMVLVRAWQATVPADSHTAPSER
jgi:hypothetical protein